MSPWVPPGTVPHNAVPIEARLVKVQALAGALFFVFLVMHLANTVLAIFGAPVYDAAQQLLQQIYQHPVLELGLVVGPLLTHAVVGVWLFFIRRKRRKSTNLRARLHRWAGMFLLLVVFGHVLATRGISYFFNAEPGFSGVAFSLWWVPGYFYPYYFLLFMAGLYHGLSGVGTVRRRFRRRAAPAEVPKTVLVAGAGAILCALLSFGGQLRDIADPRVSDYARQYSALFGVDLTRSWQGEMDDTQ